MPANENNIIKKETARIGCFFEIPDKSEIFSLAGIPPLAGFFAKFYIFTSVIEQKMYTLAIIGLLTTVISAFYYLKIIKTIYFDDSVITFDPNKNKVTNATIIISCSLIITFFLYPSILNNIVNSLFIN